MSLSPNHDDLVHAQEGSSRDRAFETAGAVVHPFNFDHPDMFSYDMISPDLSATTEAPVGNADDSDIDCQVVNTLLTIILQESQEENKGDAHEEEEHPSINVTTRKKRRPKRTAMWTDQDGRRRPILPRQTYWYSTYVSAPDLDNPQFHVLFRLRFRLPHAQFLELNHRLENEALFSRWHDGKVNPWSRVQSTPISLLLLTSLRYLGRGWTFDDLAENTSISEETIRVFFHVFIDFGSTVLYSLYVCAPTNCHEASQHTAEYEMAGFPGAVGSTDATHIMLERVSYRLRQTHIGFKMSHTARTYNITVNHRRQILATTSGHPARWNDKTLALFDNFMTDLKDGIILQDMFFDLYESSDGTVDADDSEITVPAGIVKTRRYQGAWLLVDNGYLAWPTTVPPIKTTSSRIEIRFSSWLESMRKDVECTFGILKGRWRILKTGIRLNGVESADKIFLTCCALHNWLLETDGFATTWNNGVSTVNSDWDGPLGEHSPEDDYVIPQAIRNLHNPVAMRTYDLSGMGPGSDIEEAENSYDIRVDNPSHSSNQENDHESEEEQAAVPIVVRNLSLADFRKRLITHFDIAYQRREIKWPSAKNTSAV